MRAWNVTESDLRAIADEIGVKLAEAGALVDALAEGLRDYRPDGRADCLCDECRADLDGPPYRESKAHRG